MIHVKCLVKVSLCIVVALSFTSCLFFKKKRYFYIKNETYKKECPIIGVKEEGGEMRYFDLKIRKKNPVFETRNIKKRITAICLTLDRQEIGRSIRTINSHNIYIELKKKDNYINQAETFGRHYPIIIER